MVQFEEVRCKSCGICVAFCPKKCLEITDKINEKGHRIAGITDQACCVSCGICYTVCPDVAIAVS